MNFYRTAKGFTFIEITVVLIILVILINIPLVVYPAFQLRAQFDIESQELIENIRNARFKSMMGEKNSQYGIYFYNTGYTFFEGATYDGPKETDRIIPLSERVEIIDIDFQNSENTLVFQKGSGNTDNEGSLAIKIRDQEEKKVIHINKIGNVEWVWEK